MSISTLGSYRQNYSLRSPEKPNADSDESRLLSRDEGVKQFEDAPSRICSEHLIQANSNPDVDKKFLWVIRKGDVPIVLELAQVSRELKSKRCTHTNLTGGADAFCGGEVWFLDFDRIIVNGSSGRYPPEDSGELEAVVDSLAQAGYKVCSMGWDKGTDRPARKLMGEPQWD